MKPADRFANVRTSAIRRIAALRRDSSIDLGLGEPDLDPPQWLREEAARIAREASWRYSPNAGLPLVRETVAEYAGASGQAEVCVTAGAEEAIHAVLQAYVNPGDEVLVPNPGFLAYPALARLAGGSPVEYELEPARWDVDTDRLEALVSERTRAIIVNSPANPTGSVVSAEALDRIVEIAERHSMVVVFDEVYREIWYDAPPPSPRASECVIRIGGVSKSHSMTGLRLGWAVAGETLLAPVIVAHQYITTCASVFSQLVAAAALSSRENRGWLETLRAHFARRRSAAVDAWESGIGTPVEAPGGAFYLFAPVPSCATEAFALELASDDDVLVIPGSAFGSAGEGWFRVSYAAEEAAIREGIARIAARLERSNR